MDSNLRSTSLSNAFKALDESARLWVFQANRRLNSEESKLLQKELAHFLPQWTSHNKSLLADGQVFFDHFVVIALDQVRSTSASGCSIDSMTKQIQHIAANLKIDLMDRSIFYFLIDDVIRGFPMTRIAEAYRLGEITDDSLVFNNLIKTKSELYDAWLVPLKNSWHFRFV